MDKTEKSRRRQRTLIAFLIAWGAILASAVIGLCIYDNYRIARTEITVADGALPPSFDGYKIAHVSDLHNREFGRGSERLLSILEEERPDMIAITGDLIDSHRTDVDAAVTFAAGAVKIAPTFYVTGNHEAASDKYGELAEKLAGVGVAVIDDSSAKIYRRSGCILICGLRDPNFDMLGCAPDERAAAVRDKLCAMIGDGGEFVILLSHRPELFDAYASSGVDLALCGHAHGGQFRIPFIGGVYAPDQGFLPKYDAGIYESGRCRMAVSRGLGNSVIPFRLNNPPELLILTLKRDAG